MRRILNHRLLIKGIRHSWLAENQSLKPKNQWINFSGSASSDISSSDNNCWLQSIYLHHHALTDINNEVFEINNCVDWMILSSFSLCRKSIQLFHWSTLSVEKRIIISIFIIFRRREEFSGQHVVIIHIWQKSDEKGLRASLVRGVRVRKWRK